MLKRVNEENTTFLLYVWKLEGFLNQQDTNFETHTVLVRLITEDLYTVWMDMF